jgi:hypothetical protein
MAGASPMPQPVMTVSFQSLSRRSNTALRAAKNISVPPDRQSAARDRQDISSVNVHTTQFPGGEVRGEVRVVP